MTVQELIDKLSAIPDKTKDVVFPSPDGFFAVDNVDESPLFTTTVVVSTSDSNKVYRAIG